MNIGFDLDKILIDFPPLIPTNFIRKLYGQKINGHLSYRFPAKWEQKIRILTHSTFLRKPLIKNIQLLQNMKKNSKNKFFLISSRYGFLQEKTADLVKKNKLLTLFDKLYFNFHDKQPHIFKSEVIAKEHIQAYVDDDLPLITYLAKQHPSTKFFLLNEKQNCKIDKNIDAITDLSDFFKKI